MRGAFFFEQTWRRHAVVCTSGSLIRLALDEVKGWSPFLWKLMFFLHLLIDSGGENVIYYDVIRL